MRRGEGGFTLLEMIVSLAILAVIAGTLAVAFRLAVASIERGEEEALGAARIRSAIGILTRAIRSADPTGVPADNGASIPYFVGERDRVSLLSVAPVSAVPGGGFRLVSFHEVRGPAANGMALSDASPFRADGARAWDGRESSRIFIREATDVAFFYSPGPAGDGSWEWVEAWDAAEAGGLPAAVRVEFTTPSEEGPARTAFVVPIPSGGAR